MEPLCNHRENTDGCDQCGKYLEPVVNNKLKWTREELDENIRKNVSDYGAMVVVAYLYKKIYGSFPKCGMSGMQAHIAESIVEILPSNQTGKAA